MYKFFFIIPASIFLISCGEGARELNASDVEKYLSRGDSISAKTQKLLLGNVSQAINSKGVPGAVDFCNEKAIFLTDSASSVYAASIQRLSDKNRNPDNAIRTETDQRAWDDIIKLMNDTTIKQKHLISLDGKAVYYYKAIPVGMVTCLSCHGKKDMDIAPETLDHILARYPDDKATGYELGQLRGMWKVKLTE